MAAITQKEARINKVSLPAEICIHAIVGLFALACIIPFIFIIIISFSSTESLQAVGYSFFPISWSLTAYEAAFNMGSVLWQSYLNSFIVTGVGTFLSVIMTVLYAYGLARRDYPLRHFFAFFIIFTMVFGGGLAPTVMVIRNLLGLSDSLAALIVPALLVPFNVIVMRTFIKASVPESLIESARLDGSGEFHTLLTIVVPLSKPGIATVALLTAINYWNDWFNALLFIRNRSMYPLQYLLMQMQNDIDFIRRNMALIGATNINLADLPSDGLRMALCVLIVVPIACAYPFFQKYIVAGLTVGAIKE
ncbi:MAG: carbohydrate ABC transporter permease [Defluviitaleaceae bacterium]|nr:carbohydrate ABC transporter permease [Defluviitaleaceae bacterium]